MPERMQHVELMVAFGVSPVVWYGLIHDIPDIQPRGTAAWSRYF
jgi:hypothetical protein